MPISPMDELLAHQTSETFDHVFTSDRNFYDRYYFNLHPRCGELFLVAGMGQYPNLGTTDAFVCVVYKGIQYVVRASRELGANRMDTRVGPFGVEVLEGLKKIRIWCEATEHDVAFDLVFDGTAPAVEEPRQFTRQMERVTMDTSRYTQMGVWQGSLTIAGKTIDINAQDYMGVRDHSWGVRQIGEPEPLGIRIKEYMDGFGFFHTWVPLQFEDYQIKIFVEEDMNGDCIVEECIRIDSFAKGGSVHALSNPGHKFNYASGTRELASAEFEFTDERGQLVTVTATPLTTVYLAGGSGYIAKPDWTHGMYHGPLKIEGLRFDLGDPQTIKELAPLYETLSRFELSTGEVTYGLLENLSIGVHKPYGFDSFEAVAP